MKTKIPTKPKNDSILRNKTFLSRKRLLPFATLERKEKKLTQRDIIQKSKNINYQKKKALGIRKKTIKEDEKQTINDLSNEGKKYLSLLLPLNSTKKSSKKTSKSKTINVISVSTICHKFLQQISVDEFLLTLEN